MEYKIVTGDNASALNQIVNDYVKLGWFTKGSHQIIRKHTQNRFAGMQHKDTTYTYEYSQTLTRKE